MEFKNGVTQRDYLCMKIRLESPLCVSGGEDEYTDRDVERDFDGNPFVPGTSLAGAFRNYLLRMEGKAYADKLFGYIDGQNGCQSRFSVSDLTFENGYTISIRSQTKLEHKVAATGSKFDLENIEKGAAGTFYMELEFRENDSDDLKAAAYRFLKRIVYGIDSGEITFGSNKSSGFGHFSIEKIYGRGFGVMHPQESVPDACSSLQDYLIRKNCFFGFSGWPDFDKWDMQADENELDCKELYPDEKTSMYTTLEVPLKLTGTINIRQYITEYKSEDDSKHIYRSGKLGEEIPIIPGSSWKGAIRSQCERILRELGIWKESLVLQMFGFIEKDKAKNAQPHESGAGSASISNVFIEESDIDACIPDAGPESVLDGRDIDASRSAGHYQPVTRNQINRFTGSTVNHALLQEQVYVHGKCSLTIHICKDADESGADKNAWMAGLLLLAIKDLQNGYLAVGGETGIGRGIFGSDGMISIDGEKSGWDSSLVKKYLEKLAEKKDWAADAAEGNGLKERVAADVE